MSKRKIDVTETVMDKINKGEIKMRPRWYFVLGSVAVFVGVFGTFLVSSFLVSLVSFSLRTHGPMGEYRLQQMLGSFPWWALILSLFGLAMGVFLLKKYDFSYKKNFGYIILAFVLAVLASGLVADRFGLEKMWANKPGVMRKMYQQYDGRGKVLPWRSNDDFVPGNGRRWKNGLR